MNDPASNAQLEILRKEVAALRAQLEQRSDRRTGRLGRVFVGVLVALMALAGTTAAQLITFNPGQPATASQVNANFLQLKTWLEQKVGGVPSNNVSVGGTLAVTGAATHGGATALNGATRIQTGATSNASAASGKPLFVSGVASDGSTGTGGVEFRHDNLTQGVGIGYNTIYATGSNADQALNLRGRGTSGVIARGDLTVTGRTEVGHTIHSCGDPYGVASCSCPAGTQVLGGGLECQPSDGKLVASYPVNATTWRAGCCNDANCSYPKWGANFKLVCARIQ